MEISLEGIFRGNVLKNDDPYNQERLFISVDGVHDKTVGVWAEKISTSNYISGDIPNVGAIVFVSFIRDATGEYNPNDCVWLGQSNFRKY